MASLLTGLEPAGRELRADIDGLRGVAVGAVVIFHAFPALLPGGYLGVDVFFVISGFLITRLITQELATTGRFSFADFYTRRVRRIVPALVVMLTGVLALGWFALLDTEFALLGLNVRAAALFVSNIRLQSEAGYFDAPSQLKPLLHLWSLSIEEQFYVVWPLALVLARRCALTSFRLALALATASLVVQLWLTQVNPDGTYFLSEARAWELLIGALLATQKWLGNTDAGGWGVTAVAGAGLMLVAASFAWVSEERSLFGAAALIPTSGATLMLWAGPKAWFNRSVLSLRPLVELGRLSYPLYLWHWPLLAFLALCEPLGASCELRLGALALSLILAWLTVWLVERPIRAVPANARLSAAWSFCCWRLAEQAGVFLPVVGSLSEPRMRSPGPFTDPPRLKRATVHASGIWLTARHHRACARRGRRRPSFWCWVTATRWRSTLAFMRASRLRRC